jgi:hypothetical protein
MDARLIWRSRPAPPIADVQAWRLKDSGGGETVVPDAGPPSNAVEQVEPHGWITTTAPAAGPKFMAGDCPPEQRRWREQHPEILTEGYVTTDPEKAEGVGGGRPPHPGFTAGSGV